MAQRMQHCYLGMEPARQRTRVTRRGSRSFREIDRQEKLFQSEHGSRFRIFACNPSSRKYTSVIGGLREDSYQPRLVALRRYFSGLAVSPAGDFASLRATSES